MKKWLPLIIILVIVFGIFRWGVGLNNTMVEKQETGKTQWANVESAYQRRADLIPNLIATVKGYAKHEKDVLTEVTKARSKVSNMTIPKDILTNPVAFKKFQEAQGRLGNALSRLLAVSERYPDLKADKNFLALQSQLEGTENRIAVARRDYIQAVKKYNLELRTIPNKWIAHLLYPDAKLKQTFSITKKESKVPQVNFD